MGKQPEYKKFKKKKPIQESNGERGPFYLLNHIVN